MNSTTNTTTTNTTTTNRMKCSYFTQPVYEPLNHLSSNSFTFIYQTTNAHFMTNIIHLRTYYAKQRLPPVPKQILWTKIENDF